MQTIQPVPVILNELAPCKSNHIGHLQRWPAELHDGCRSSLRLLVGRCAEHVQRTGRRADMETRDVQVNSGLFQITITEQHLNRPEVCSGFQQMCGEAVPQRMWMHLGSKPPSLCRTSAATAQEQGTSLRCSPPERFPLLAKTSGQRREDTSADKGVLRPRGAH
jgi:hypothetical protein